MDNFREEVVVRHKTGFYTIMYYLTWVMIIGCGLIAISALTGLMNMIGGQFDTQSLIMSIVMLVLFGGAGYMLWRNKDELRTEYEYSFTNGELDVAKVLNNSKRRYLTSLPLKNVESCGDVTHASFQRYLSMKDVKKHNWFLNRGAKLYYFYFTKKGVKHLIILELSDTMVELIRSRNYLNFGVWQH